MREKCSSNSGDGQHNLQACAQLLRHMDKAGFVLASQMAYKKAFMAFAAKLDRKRPDQAPVADARRYLSWLKPSGALATAFSHASATLRFYFED